MTFDFEQAFKALTGHQPLPWQRALYDRMLVGDIPSACDIPTGLGKTSVIAMWLLARAAGAGLPTRLVYVVNRRTVVDQTTVEVERLRQRLPDAGIAEPLALSTLRGQMADNREWSADPSRPAVICGTVDMIGSRLLFSGYRSGFKTKPLHAGFLGQDALLVHDEAHLEPAFQSLLERICDEQKRCNDRWPLYVMALTATQRDRRAAFGLSDDDLAHAVVQHRIHASKRLSLHQHGATDLMSKVVAQVISYQESECAVLVFLRTVDDVASAAAQFEKARLSVRQLTGTLRGYERDRLVVEDPVFQRFLRESDRKAPAATGTVVLVCTSAGEVGVNLSADHLVCDLSTFDSMTQRFGRVNRFGDRADSEVHVFHPAPDALDPESATDVARLRTLALLGELGGSASPFALGRLDPEARSAAFAPAPDMLPATEILFDAWAMTTIRGELPGRPPVGVYLHGVPGYEPPMMQVAWRDEVDLISESLQERHPPADLLDDYPLKPHELLSDRVARILDTLAAIVRHHEAARSVSVWDIDEQGQVQVVALGELLSGDRKRREQELEGHIVLLPPRLMRPVRGMLSVESWCAVDSSASNTSPEASTSEAAIDPGAADVADAWLDEHGKPRRRRLFEDERVPRGMRWIRTVALGVDPDDQDATGPDAPTLRYWRWYETPYGGDGEGSRSAAGPVRLDVHSADVERHALEITGRLQEQLSPGLRRAIVLAAKHHDDGKNRRIWQRSIGNPDAEPLYAKSGHGMRALELTAYRHELGSIIDAERCLSAELEPEELELALHLIAAHHGRARPHFPEPELFDPEVRGVDVREQGIRVMQRFAHLQRRFGRWGLAYLESLVRAADYAASASPSRMEEAW